MKKRTFLKISSAIITRAALTPLANCTMKKGIQEQQLKNWAGNLTYNTSEIAEPTTIEEVQQIVSETDTLRVLGTRHCFNQIANSNNLLLSTKHLNKIISLNENSGTITVGAGIRYGELCQYLDERGFALHNLASLPHISIAGACATATHGSGVKNGNLATAITALEMVKANGDITTLSNENNPDAFCGAVVGLGALGVVTKMTLALQPTFKMAQVVYLNLPMEQLFHHFDEIMSSGYSVSLFTDWQNKNINQVWIKRKVGHGELSKPDKEFHGSTLADRNVHPIIEISAENCTEQMGVPGPWYERLPHFKMGFTPSSGEELQAEYFVPYSQAVEAIKAVESLHGDIKPYLMISEIRTIDADSLWMSPCYHQQCVAIHFTLKQDIDGVNSLLPKIEEKLSPFNARPHWGKLFTIPSNILRSRYERLMDFQKLATEFDPSGKFRNDFVNKNIFSE